MEITQQDVLKVGRYVLNLAAAQVALGHVSAVGTTDYAASDGDPMCDFVLDMFLACAVGVDESQRQPDATERIEAFVARYDLVRKVAESAALAIL